MKKTKKLLMLLAVVTTALVCFALSASALNATGQCGDNVYWEYDSTTGELVISGEGAMWDYYYIDWAYNPDSPFYDSNIKSVVINNGVTTIGDYAFYDCDSLTEVTIGDSVTTIGYYAFWGCSSLTEVTIGDSVTTIGYYAFYDCDSLTSITVDENNQYFSNDEYGVLFNKDKTTLIQYPIGNKRTAYTIPDSVTTIGNGAFAWCDSLKEVTIPDSVTTIGSGAFYNTGYYNNASNWEDGVLYIGEYLIDAKSNLSGSYEIKDGTKVIAAAAFDYCYSLTEVTIGDSVTTIGVGAFRSCDSLTDITVDKNNLYFSNDEYGVLFNKDKTTLIQYPTGYKRTAYTIPDSVTTIGDKAFYNCGSLTEVTIPGSVTTIGEWAFYNCYSLTEVTIPDSVTTIGDKAFYNCYSLTEVTIPDSVTTIGSYAFYDCHSLTEVTIGDSVTTIGGYAFWGCSSLTEVTIGDGVTTIGYYAFYDCDSLESVYASDAKSWLNIKFNDYDANPLNSGVDLYFNGEFVTDLVLPDSVTSIGDYAFYGCDSLTEVTIPDSVTTIGYRAFSSCHSLTEVTIPDSVTTIGDYAFHSCFSLTEVTIGDSVTTIGDGAFSWCDRLTDVYYGGTQEQWKKIKIGSYNSDLTGANIHYNYCMHTESTVQPQQDATCTANGYTAGTYCLDCEKWVEGHVVIEKLPHSFTQYIYDENATCTVDGTKTSKCDNCDTKSTIIAENTKTNHKNKVDYSKQNPTCTEIGYTAGVYCPDCKKWLSGHSTISAKGHSYTEKIIDSKHLKSKATIEAAAVYKYDCANCDSISPDKTFTHGNALALGVTSSVTSTQTASSITLTWSEAENATGYRLYYKLPGDISWRNALTYTVTTEHTFENLPAGQKYRFAVQSAYKKADGSYIRGGYKEIETATKAVAPSKVTATQTASTIKLTWTASAGADGYKIFYKSGGKWKTTVSSTTATSHTFKNLKAGAKYTFAIQPYTKVDGSTIYGVYTEYTTATLPATVTAKVSSTSKGKINLSWNQVNVSESYQIWYKKGDGSFKLYKTVGASKNSMSFSNLKSGTKYTFAVRAGIKTSGGNIYGAYKTASVTVK